MKTNRERAIEIVGEKPIDYGFPADLSLVRSWEMRVADIERALDEAVREAVAAAVLEEREACAKVADGILFGDAEGCGYCDDESADRVATAIRARGAK